jgi:hypothetical protein
VATPAGLQRWWTLQARIVVARSPARDMVDPRPHPARERTLDWTLDVVILPVGAIDRSVAFYRD